MATTGENDKQGRSELRHFLTRYYRAKQERDALRGRIARLERKHLETDAEIVEQLRKQERETSEVILEIVETIGLLPPGHQGKLILQMRHLDCYPWPTIQAEVHLTRASCYRHYRSALDDLLRIPEVQGCMAEWAARKDGTGV